MSKDPLDEIRELLRMAAVQTAENAKELREFRDELRASAKLHDREMKEIRKMIERITV